MNDDTLCKCGHALGDHHQWYLAGGGTFADECEVHGSNEIGGKLKQHLDGSACPAMGIWYRFDRESGKWLSPEGHTEEEDDCGVPEEGHVWVDHCFHFEKEE